MRLIKGAKLQALCCTSFFG